MQRFFLPPSLWPLALAGLLAFPLGAARAQVPLRPGITYRPPPTVSPYVNLSRTNNLAGVNYFGVVRPQVNLRNSVVGLEQEVDANRQAIQTGTATGQANQSVTGHGAVYLNTGGIFLNLNAQPGVATARGGYGAPGSGIVTNPLRNRRATVGGPR